ncbi:MAG: hypothetical protein FJ211_05515 [Ignavibacteria bacterium]|nr:hypothetical protein [Ignavibacteria bacterium]
MGTITTIRRNRSDGGRCSVFVDDEFLAACPIDVALALGLRKGLVMTDELERKLRKEDRRIVLRQKSYRFATYKPRTEKNVVDFLTKAEATPEEIESVLSWLREFRLIDDIAYATKFLEASRERKPLSRIMARRTLLTKGVPQDIVDRAIEEHYQESDALEGARVVARKKLRMLASQSLKQQEEKLVRFLQYRGYGWDVIKLLRQELHQGTLMLIALSVVLGSFNLPAQVDMSCSKVRLPDAINKFQPTTQPVLGPEGELYLDRKYHPDNLGGANDPDDVWVSYNKQGQWTNAELADIRIFDTVMKAYVNAEVVFGMTKDGLHALAAGRFMKNSLNLSLAFLNRESIKAPFTEVGVIVPTLSKNFFATFAEDIGAVIVALELAEGKGDLDLYVIKIGDCDGPQELKPLGSGINTPAFEGAPWIACDNRTMYFASAGREDRRGKADLYMTRRLDATWQNWSEPVNLGLCINTTEDETAISLSCGSSRAFVTSWDAQSDRPGVYTVDVPQHLLPAQVNDVRINVRNALTNEPVVGCYVSIQPESTAGRCVTGHHTVTVDKFLGHGTTVLPQDSAFVMKAIPFDGKGVGVASRVTSGRTDVTAILVIVPTDKPLLSIYFDKGQATLTPESHAALESLRSKIGSTTLPFVGVRAYTDASGSRATNDALARERARIVAEQCTMFVFDGKMGRVKPIAYGVEKINGKPVEDDSPQSRRVDIYAIAR